MIVNPNSSEQNPLWDYFINNEQRVIHKYHHYFDIYHNHFNRFRDQEITRVEIGVNQGGSLQMWKHYFGPKVTVYGVDINPACLQVEEERINIIIGDQSDRNFLRSLKDKINKVDILIDDGGHTMDQQLNTFEELYDWVSETGVYLVEDVHTSYWRQFGGRFRKRKNWFQRESFVEFSKDLIDQLNVWYVPQRKKNKLIGTGILLERIKVSKSTTGIHFYDSVVVFEKYPNPSKPLVSETGNIRLQ